MACARPWGGRGEAGPVGKRRRAGRKGGAEVGLPSGRRALLAPVPRKVCPVAMETLPLEAFGDSHFLSGGISAGSAPPLHSVPGEGFPC